MIHLFDSLPPLQGIANSFARILLVHYGWDEERLLSDFFERGIDYVYKSAGVVAPKENEDEEAGADKASSDGGDADDDLNPSAKCRKKEVACERYNVVCVVCGQLLKLATQLHGRRARGQYDQARLWSQVLQRLLPGTQHRAEHSPAARVFPKAKATHVKLTFAVCVVLVV